MYLISQKTIVFSKTTVFIKFFVNDNPSLTIVNDDPLLTIVNIIVNFFFKNDRLKKQSFFKNQSHKKRSQIVLEKRSFLKR